jgi:hypothetical protein
MRRHTLDPWARVRRAADAFTAVKFLGAVAAFFIWRASPLYALGIVLALPLVAALGLLILRWLHAALTGDNVGFWAIDPKYRAPSERLGRPSWERQPNASIERAARSTPIRHRPVRTYSSRSR